jgi:hypothetical protein
MLGEKLGLFDGGELGEALGMNDGKILGADEGDD